jgi:opacity protein-like surface antigen
MALVKRLLCVSCLICLLESAYAADASANSALPITPVKTESAVDTPSPGRHEFSLWGGVSPNSPHFIGAAAERNLSTLGLRYSRSLKQAGFGTLRYTFDAIPVAFIRQPVSHGIWEDRTHRESRFGAGLSPIGVQLNLRPHSRIQPFGEGNVGFLYFTRPTPYTNTSNFNFTFSLGAGLQTFTVRNRAVSFGYKYHHLSNAFMVPVNPGVDSNVFYVGYSLFR